MHGDEVECTFLKNFMLISPDIFIYIFVLGEQRGQCKTQYPKFAFIVSLRSSALVLAETGVI